MRTKITKIAAASMALISVPATAAAADHSYSADPQLTPDGLQASISGEDWSRVVAQRVAACLIRIHRPQILKAIEREPWQPGASHMLEDAVDPKCLGNGEVVMPPDLFRGALYQRLYRERFASRPPALPPAAPDFTAMTANLSDEAKSEVALRQFGDCVARRDLSDANSFILSVPGTEQETTALTSLMPHFSSCLVQGSKWTLTKSSVSGILSEVIYREAAAGPAEASK